MEWITGALGSLGVLVGVWLHGRKSGADKVTAQTNAAYIEARHKLDAFEQAATVKMEEAHKVMLEQMNAAQQNLAKKQSQPVTDADVDRVLEESNAAAEIERADSSDR